LTNDEIDRLLERLRVFSEIPGPSGREELVREFLLERWRERLATLDVDSRGNVLGTLGSGRPRLALAAHMDEVGWVVRHVTADGFLIVDTTQGPRREGPPLRHMIGHEVHVLGRSGVVASGVFTAASGHVMTREQVERQRLDWPDFFVDLGIGTRREAEAAGVHIGSPVVFAGPPRRVGRRIVGKAMDDRVSLCVVDVLLERLAGASLGCSLVVVATVHEEGGVHGADAAAREIDCDAAVVLDVGLVGDVPSVGVLEHETRLGGGPTLVHKDGHVVYDHRLTWSIADAAAAGGIAFQHGVYSHYGSDGIAFVHRGVPTALVGIPTRYTHTAFEMVEPIDVVATVELLARLATDSDFARGVRHVTDLDTRRPDA